MEFEICNSEFVTCMTIHKSVLLNETIEALNLKKGMAVVDATLGGGGHSKAVLKKIGKEGTLVAFDQDAQAIDRFRKMAEAGGAVLFHDNFVALKDRLASMNISAIDAIVADLGISSDQLDDFKRGLSFLTDGPLDMRMNQADGITAADIVNTYSQEQLVDILKKYGDEQYASRIAWTIVKSRALEKIVSTAQLVSIITRSVPAAYAHKKTHPATRTFQALRIEVNQELCVLESFLSQAVDVLKSKGRLAVITFHSGEDALVKGFFRENARGCICPSEFPVCVCNKKPKLKLITKKPIVPSSDEIADNVRARSARLRVVEKID